MDSAEYSENNDIVRWQLLCSAGSCTGSDWVTQVTSLGGQVHFQVERRVGGEGGEKVSLAQDAR